MEERGSWTWGLKVQALWGSLAILLSFTSSSLCPQSLARNKPVLVTDFSCLCRIRLKNSFGDFFLCSKPISFSLSLSCSLPPLLWLP